MLSKPNVTFYRTIGANVVSSLPNIIYNIQLNEFFIKNITNEIIILPNSCPFGQSSFDEMTDEA